MIQEIIKAFILIFIAEMGDKTQILAMAFATKYPVKKVLAGIFLGVLINHGIAVFLGSYISGFIPINIVQSVAGFAFIGFAIWTLKYEEEEAEEENQKIKWGPTLTVAAAFFIGELGDKTQLSAITLAAGASYPLAILTGTVTGMMVTGGIGIFIGKKLGDKIPELAIKIVAASVFMLFGIGKLYQNLPKEYLEPIYILLFIALALSIMILMIRKLIVKKREKQESAFTKQARELHDFYSKVGENLDNLCLGNEHCGECLGQNCIVGHTKALIQNGLNDKEEMKIKNFIVRETNKKYNKEEAIEILKITLEMIKNNPNSQQYQEINQIRNNLEIIIFGKRIEKMDNWPEYIKTINDIDEVAATKILCNK
jgi:Ca2+/H+ antiporter, TMEM165/GDT1 family